MEKRIFYLSNTVIPNTKREKNIHVFNVLTQVGVKQLTDFLRTVTAASDLVDCTLVNCGYQAIKCFQKKTHLWKLSPNIVIIAVKPHVLSCREII